MTIKTSITNARFLQLQLRSPRWGKAKPIVATLKKQNTPVWFWLAKTKGHGFAKKKVADFQFTPRRRLFVNFLCGKDYCQWPSS